MQSNHYSSLFAIYMATFLAGFTGLFARTIPADALSITQMRCTVAVLCFCVFMGLTRRSLRLESRGQYVGIWGLGLLMGAHWASYFHGMQVSSIAIGMLAFFSYPVITVLLEPLFARTKISLVDIVAAALVLIGVFFYSSWTIPKGWASCGCRAIYKGRYGVCSPRCLWCSEIYFKSISTQPFHPVVQCFIKPWR